MIGEAETGGIASLQERMMAIGDGGLAGGRYQQHWAWRKDYWPSYAWEILEMLDARAINNYLSRHRNMTARDLAHEYNLGHEAPDPDYDERCLSGLRKLGIDSAEYDKPVIDL